MMIKSFTLILSLWLLLLAPQATQLLITPTTTTLQPDETVVLAVEIADVVDLYGVDIELKFDPQLFAVVDADMSAAGVQITPLDTFLSPDFVVRNGADNQQGTIRYAATQINPTAPASGSGALFTIELKALQAGVGRVEFLQQTLSDPSGDELVADGAPATVTIIANDYPLFLPLIVTP